MKTRDVFVMLVVVLMLGGVCLAGYADVLYDGSTLPSSQGWTHYNEAESDYSSDGDVLTLSQPQSRAYSYYYREAFVATPVGDGVAGTVDWHMSTSFKFDTDGTIDTAHSGNTVLGVLLEKDDTANPGAYLYGWTELILADWYNSAGQLGASDGILEIVWGVGGTHGYVMDAPDGLFHTLAIDIDFDQGAIYAARLVVDDGVPGPWGELIVKYSNQPDWGLNARMSIGDAAAAQATAADGWNWDYIEDGSGAVPEPATIALLGLGGILLRRKRN